ncbi:Mannosyl-oligosaccharide 1,2-alpha-mannosidase IB [Sparganum proliferum]
MKDSSENPRRQVDNVFVQAIVSPSSSQLPGTCLSSSISAYLDYLNNAVCLGLITYRSQELSSMRLTFRPLRFGRVVYALCVVVGVGFLFYTFAAFRDLSPSTSDSGGVNPRILFPSAPIRGNNGSGPNRPKSPAGESLEQQGRMQWVQLPDGNPIAHPVAGAPAVVPEVGIPVPPKLPEFPVPDSDSDKDRPPGVVEPPRLPVEGRGTPLSVDEVRGGEPSDDLNKERRNKVKDMMKHAWTSYRNYAWGANELRPLSKTGHQPSILGSAPMGATIVDAIDTLYIMGLDKEYGEAKQWIEESLKFTVVCNYRLALVSLTLTGHSWFTVCNHVTL